MIQNKPFLRVILDWQRYTGESIDETIDRIRKSKQLSSHEWREIVKTGSDKETMKFCAESVFYVYETFSPYLEPGKYGKDTSYRRISDFAKRLLQERGNIKVVDFGGGAGELCLLLQQEGIEVTYVDIKGRMPNFAIWRFSRHRAKTKVTRASSLCLLTE